VQSFVADHLVFWLVMYGLALTAWACVGRFMMQAFVAPDSPNYIWRGFRLLTDWAIWLARRAVPSYIPIIFLPVVAACWLFGTRMVVGIFMIVAGLAPRLTPSAGG